MKMHPQFNFLGFSFCVSLLLALGLVSCRKGADNDQRQVAIESHGNQRPLPRSFTALSDLGKIVNSSKEVKVQLDENFWSAITEEKPGIVYLSDGNDRNSVYAGLFYIVRMHNSGSASAGLENTTAALRAVLGYGLFSDYLAVSGAVTRIQAKFGDDYIRGDPWIHVFEKLDDIGYFIDAEMSSAETRAQSAKDSGSKTAYSELAEVYKDLFRRSGNIEQLRANVVTINREMELALKSNAPAVAELYFAGPAMEKLAVPVYRNRTIRVNLSKQSLP